MTQSVAVWPEADPSVVAPIPEHEELREVVRHLLSRDADHEAVRRAADLPRGWSDDLWQRLNKELDLGSMIVPEALGGAGFGLRDLAVVLEETGAALLPEPVLESSVLTSLALSMADDAGAVAALLAAVMAGDVVGTVTLAGGVEVADGAASGMLARVVAGADSDLVVFGGADGVYAVRTGQAGVEARPLEVLDVTRRQADVVLDGAEVIRVVGPDRTAAVWSRLGRAATVAVAAEHVGIIRHQLEATVTYVGQRHQFGRPIGSFQAIKHRLADVLVDLERARSAVVYAAALFDEDPDAALAAEVAGAVTTEAVIRTVHEAVQLHGGIGFTWEHPAHFYLKRALGDEGIFGAARAHRAALADLVGI
jgi:acyl-CoA dehydrogenase